MHQHRAISRRTLLKGVGGVAVGLHPSLYLKLAEAEALRFAGNVDESDALFAHLRVGLTHHAVKAGYARAAGKSLRTVDYPVVAVEDGTCLYRASVKRRKIFYVASTCRLGHSKTGKGGGLLLRQGIEQLQYFLVPCSTGRR